MKEFKTTFKFKRVRLKKSDYKSFMGFLKFSKTSLLSGIVPASKLKRVAFLEYFVLGNKGLLAEKGFQLYTTLIAYKLKIDAETAMNYIKDLQKCGLLICINNKWVQGKRAKTYRIRSGSHIIDTLNKYSGYKTDEKIILKAEYREKRWKSFDPYTANIGDIVALAQTYLGCRKSYLKEIFKRVPISVLKMPRENDRLRPKIYDYYLAFKIVTNNANESKPAKDFNNFTGRFRNAYKCPRGIKAFLKGFDKFDYVHYSSDGDDERNTVNRSIRSIMQVFKIRAEGDLTFEEVKKISHTKKVVKWIRETMFEPLERSFYESYEMGMLNGN